MPTYIWYTNVTDTRMDERLTIAIPRFALRASRGKNVVIDVTLNVVQHYNASLIHCCCCCCCCWWWWWWWWWWRWRWDWRSDLSNKYKPSMRMSDCLYIWLCSVDRWCSWRASRSTVLLTRSCKSRSVHLARMYISRLFTVHCLTDWLSIYNSSCRRTRLYHWTSVHSLYHWRIQVWADREAAPMDQTGVFFNLYTKLLVLFVWK